VVNKIAYFSTFLIYLLAFNFSATVASILATVALKLFHKQLLKVFYLPQGYTCDCQNDCGCCTSDSWTNPRELN